MREGRRGRRPGSSGALSQLLLLITSLQTLSAAEIIRYDGDVNIGKSIGKLNLKCDKSFNFILKYLKYKTCLARKIIQNSFLFFSLSSSITNVEIKIKSFSNKSSPSTEDPVRHDLL